MKGCVLLITPYFAPQTHAAMFRVHKLAKYLPRYGWKPVVLTTDTNYLYNENHTLLDELPPEVEVFRARFVEPTMRGLRMALGGNDRTFSALKRQKRLSGLTNGKENGSTEESSLAKRIYRRFLKGAVHRPDVYWTWRRPAYRTARRLIREKGISVVYTTTLPYTTLQIGDALQRTTSCRWVADLRDPGTYSHRTRSSNDAVYIQQRRIERRALWSADAVTGASSAFGHIFEDMHGPGIFDRIHFIPTGADESLLPGKATIEQGHLVFAGEYLPEYGDSFWRILRAALDIDHGLHDVLSVSVIGNEQLNRTRISPYLGRYRLAEYVRFVDHLSQKELYRRLAKAHAGLLIPGVHGHWWTSFAKMVDYIALKKPVLALVPNPSEARNELNRAGLGVFLDGTLDEAANVLASFLRNDRAPSAKPEVCSAYMASSQVESFVEIFDSVSRYAARRTPLYATL